MKRDEKLIDKQRLLERMHMELDIKYLTYHESAKPEDPDKRRLKAEGFVNAIEFVNNFK